MKKDVISTDLTDLKRIVRTGVQQAKGKNMNFRPIEFLATCGFGGVSGEAVKNSKQKGPNRLLAASY